MSKVPGCDGMAVWYAFKVRGLEALRHLAGVYDTHGHHMRQDERKLMQEAVDLFYHYRKGSSL